MLHWIRHIVVSVFGSLLLFLGIAMLILPGPGILTIIVALSLLGIEFAWARKLLRNIKKDVRKTEKMAIKLEKNIEKGFDR